MQRLSIVLATLSFVACTVNPEGTDGTNTIEHTNTVHHTVTVTVPNTITVTNTVEVEPPPPVVYPDVMTPLGTYQVPALLGAYSHLLDLDTDGQGLLFAASFYPNTEDVSDPTAMVNTGMYVEADSVSGRHHYVSYDNGEVLVDGIKSALRRFTIDANGVMTEAASWLASDDRVQYGSDLEGNFAYVALAQDGVSIRDRATLQTELGVIPAPNAVDVIVIGTDAFVLDRDLGLVIYDVNYPASPSLVATLPLDGAFESMVLDGDTLVVCAGEEVHIIDVSKRDAPSVLSTIDSGSGLALRADLEGDALVFAEYNDWRVYDISDPTDPILVGVEDAWDAALSVRIDGDTVYGGDWDLLKSWKLDLTAEAPELDFAWPIYIVAPIGHPAQAAAIVSNLGTETLEVSDIFCPSIDGVTVTPTSFSIAPGGAEAITIDLAFVMPTADVHTCTIVTNDADEQLAPLMIEVNRDGLGVNEAAPTLVLPDLDGLTHTLSDFEGVDTDLDGDLDGGKVVYLHLFSSNCQQCVSSMAAVQTQINDVFQSDPNFESVSVSSSVVGAEDPEYLELFAAAYGLTNDQVWVDWAIPAVVYGQWAITSSEAFAPYPRHFVIGPDGFIKYASYEAELDGAIAVIQDELAKL